MPQLDPARLSSSWEAKFAERGDLAALRRRVAKALYGRDPRFGAFVGLTSLPGGDVKKTGIGDWVGSIELTEDPPPGMDEEGVRLLIEAALERDVHRIAMDAVVRSLKSAEPALVVSLCKGNWGALRVAASDGDELYLAENRDSRDGAPTDSRTGIYEGIITYMAWPGDRILWSLLPLKEEEKGVEFTLDQHQYARLHELIDYELAPLLVREPRGATTDQINTMRRHLVAYLRDPIQRKRYPKVRNIHLRESLKGKPNVSRLLSDRGYLMSPQQTAELASNFVILCSEHHEPDPSNVLVDLPPIVLWWYLRSRDDPR